ncbi:hypothetical protein PSACC_03391 [Paramicrosporidium saccamoebae]|uniref:BRWD/PHIP N-terminal domain-containing protein n=1 Tax=Paramicrosporidium saccamoebae TaxID=1246581 RepID=A0A2H9TGH8_9FUNG|nr:hypothetical protein PSACC_03391 [Paramicrosporidium saccamoebae]
MAVEDVTEPLGGLVAGTQREFPVDEATKQIYLLVAEFLHRRGHFQAARHLIKVCESAQLFPPSVNWQGDVLSTTFEHGVP